MARPVLQREPKTRGPGLNRRGWVFVSGVVIWLVLVMAYAGTAWPMAAYRLIVDGGVLVIWLVAVFGFGTWLSRLFLIKAESGESLLMFVSQTALGLGAISLVVLGLWL